MSDNETAVAIVISMLVAALLIYSVFSIRSCAENSHDARVECLEAGGNPYKCCVSFTISPSPSEDCSGLATAEKE